MMTEHLRSEAGELAVIGQATTRGQALPLGADDPVVAARAVRRALADARLHGADVESLAIATPPPLTRDAATRFVRRALGPFGADLVPVIVESVEPGADGLVEDAVRALPGDHGHLGVSIAVGISSDGTTIALCVTARRRER